VIAEIDTAEAFKPVREFGKKVLVTAAGIALLTSAIALIASYFLVKPLKLLQE
jgi:hypothetical protein